VCCAHGSTSTCQGLLFSEKLPAEWLRNTCIARELRSALVAHAITGVQRHCIGNASGTSRHACHMHTCSCSLDQLAPGFAKLSKHAAVYHSNATYTRSHTLHSMLNAGCCASCCCCLSIMIEDTSQTLRHTTTRNTTIHMLNHARPF
jgi:hypothetical protein